MSAWSGSNGSKAAKSSQSKSEDVESYFKINEVKRMVNIAVNNVAASRPADFRAALCGELKKVDNMAVAEKRAVTKEDAESAKAYLTSHQAEQLLSDVLSKLAVAMPPNPAAVLAEYIAEAPAAKPVAAPKPKEKSSPAKAAAPPPAEKKEEPKPKKQVDVMPDGVDAKKWKAAVKEGGKKGIELSGCADMGGLEFFTTQIETAEGDLVLLEAAMDAANKEIDPKDEEAKGGSQMVGKMLLSSGDKQLALMCYVPADKKDKCNATEWMKTVLSHVSGEFVSGDGLKALGKVVGNGDTRFPLKDKDTCQAMSVNWLKDKGLFPQANDEDDDWVPDEGAVEW